MSRPHLPRGTYVSVIRHEHGWEDGRISGYLIDDSGTVQIDSEGEPYTGECRHRRDYVESTPPPASTRTAKQQRREAAKAKRATRDERRRSRL